MSRWKRATPDLPEFEEPLPVLVQMGVRHQVRGPGIGIDGIREQLKQKRNGHSKRII